eukprot:GHVR01075939.1.p1 GENE.GHVR01075939.1~~GHVR01075939.1.p1  ORF type:complete len:208 (-),score=33.46 GHVR01075939.1:258-881(-)
MFSPSKVNGGFLCLNIRTAFAFVNIYSFITLYRFIIAYNVPRFINTYGSISYLLELFSAVFGLYCMRHSWMDGLVRYFWLKVANAFSLFIELTTFLIPFGRLYWRKDYSKIALYPESDLCVCVQWYPALLVVNLMLFILSLYSVYLTQGYILVLSKGGTGDEFLCCEHITHTLNNNTDTHDMNTDTNADDIQADDTYTPTRTQQIPV